MLVQEDINLQQSLNFKTIKLFAPTFRSHKQLSNEDDPANHAVLVRVKFSEDFSCITTNH